MCISLHELIGEHYNNWNIEQLPPNISIVGRMNRAMIKASISSWHKIPIKIPEKWGINMQSLKKPYKYIRFQFA